MQLLHRVAKETANMERYSTIAAFDKNRLYLDSLKLHFFPVLFLFSQLILSLPLHIVALKLTNFQYLSALSVYSFLVNTAFDLMFPYISRYFGVVEQIAS